MSAIDLWLQAWEFWAIVGLVLVVADFMVGGSGNLIALGVACFLMSAIAAVSQAAGLPLVPNWRFALVEYAVLSAAAIFVVHLLRRPPSDKDLNRY